MAKLQVQGQFGYGTDWKPLHDCETKEKAVEYIRNHRGSHRAETVYRIKDLSTGKVLD